MRLLALTVTTALVAQNAFAEQVTVGALDFEVSTVAADPNARPTLLTPKPAETADAPIIIASLSPLGSTGLGTDALRSDAVEPSLLLGLIEVPTDPSLDETDPNASGETQEITDEMIAAAAFDFDDAAAREKLRKENPELFARVIASGLTDPPANRLVRHLQAELERMNCYLGGVDGAWGNGSRRGVSAYYSVLGTDAPTREATVELYRALALSGDVQCEVVARTTPTTKQPKASSSTRKKTTTKRTTTSKPKTTTTKPKAKTKTVKKKTTTKKKLGRTSLGNTF